METERVVLELVAELLPRYLPAHFAEEPGDVLLVFGVLVAFQVCALAFNDPD